MVEMFHVERKKTVYLNEKSLASNSILGFSFLLERLNLFIKDYDKLSNNQDLN